MNLTVEEKRILLEAARKSIQTIFGKEEADKPDFKLYPILKENAGAFVTLTKKKELRGCIGYITSDKNLFDTVCSAAIQAAENDPRFLPVKENEMHNISIEVSVLSQPSPIKSYDEIKIGVHGLILEEKGRRGLLLPQVPVEHHLNKEQYLDAICNKTGFPSGYWKTKQLKLSGFTATVFSEEELGV